MTSQPHSCEKSSSPFVFSFSFIVSLGAGTITISSYLIWALSLSMSLEYHQGLVVGVHFQCPLPQALTCTMGNQITMVMYVNKCPPLLIIIFLFKKNDFYNHESRQTLHIFICYMWVIHYDLMFLIRQSIFHCTMISCNVTSIIVIGVVHINYEYAKLY